MATPLRLGDKGPRVTALQSALIRAGYPLPRFGADGSLGGETMAALAKYTGKPISGEVPLEVEAALTGAPPKPAPGPVKRIGAWAMRAAIFDPKSALASAQRAGLTDVSLCAHAQDEQGFEPFVSALKAAEACRILADGGVRPHLMFWPRPQVAHTNAVLDYIDVAYRNAPSLGSVDLDAEEQWTKSATRVTKGAEVAALYRSRWPKGLPLAVNGITGALPKILDLVAVADVVWPQAYTANKTGQTGTPGKRQTDVAAAWREKIGSSTKLCMGLAAYEQEGAGGLMAAEAMRRAFDAAAQETDEIRYWSLGNVDGGYALAFVKGKTAELRKRGGT